MKDIEQDLIKKGYWIWSKGSIVNGEKTAPTLLPTAKWSKLVKDLLKSNSMKIITLEMVRDYIVNLDADK